MSDSIITRMWAAGLMGPAYQGLLSIPDGESRLNIQPALACLRDEIARLRGSTPEAVQNEYEARANRGATP